MIISVYSLFDKKAGHYMTPYFSSNDATADRSFQALAKRDDSMVSHSPEDFALYKLGEFHDDSGVLQALPQPQHVANIKNQ